MTNIFLVRHGQTEWNQQNRLQGHKNSPLTENGRQQAIKTREALHNQIIDKAYVSPLQRATDTLDILLEGRPEKRQKNLIHLSMIISGIDRINSFWTGLKHISNCRPV